MRLWSRLRYIMSQALQQQQRRAITANPRNAHLTTRPNPRSEHVTIIRPKSSGQHGTVTRPKSSSQNVATKGHIPANHYFTTKPIPRSQNFSTTRPNPRSTHLKTITDSKESFTIWRRGRNIESVDDFSIVYEVNPLFKYFLFFFNFLLWIISIGLIGVGIYAYLAKERFSSPSLKNQGLDVYDIVFDLSIIVIALGMLLFITTFSGCIGAIRENTILLKVFCFLVVLMMISEVVLVTFAFVFSTEIRDKAQKVFQIEGIPRYMTEDQDWDDFVDWVQHTFECCGVGDAGYEDWNNNMYFNCTESNPSPAKCGVPYSCCINQTNINTGIVNTMCGYGVQNLIDREAALMIHTEGCMEAIHNTVNDNLILLGWVVLGVAIPQVMVIYLGLCLKSQVENSYPGFL